MADRADVRLVKVLLGIGLVAGLGLMWANRHFVVDAYGDDDGAAPALHLGGVDLDLELTATSPSPYLVGGAPDTRSLPAGPAAGAPSSSTGPVPRIDGGSSELSGTVSAPTGPVPLATVRVERHTENGIATVDVQSDELGRWSLPGIVGGRYRVRAWVVGLHTMNGSQVLFLNENEAETLDLPIRPIDPGPQLSFTHMGDIHLGLTGTVAASVTTRTIADDGLVYVSGVAGAVVTLTPTPGVTVSPTPAVTDSSGVARFVLRCHRVGSASAVVQYENRRATFTLPNCVEPPTSPVGAADGAAEQASTQAKPPSPVHQIAPLEVLVD